MEIAYFCIVFMAVIIVALAINNWRLTTIIASGSWRNYSEHVRLLEANKKDPIVDAMESRFDMNTPIGKIAPITAPPEMPTDDR